VAQAREQVPLGPLTTLRIGGPARRLVTAGTENELVEAVTAADVGGDRLLVLAGGSNVVIADEGFGGTVVHVAHGGHREAGERDGHVLLEAAAGDGLEPGGDAGSGVATLEVTGDQE